MIAILIDPDKGDEQSLKVICETANSINADLFFIGGSLLTDGDLNQTIRIVKENSNIPLLLFPGSSSQISREADGILFLSLLSGRNPEMLIGQQVVAAPYLRKTNLEVISTAYLLIDSGAPTTASYISNSNPIPAEKAEIAASTALAGQYMGMNLIYLDGGSGAKNPVPLAMIKKVKSYIDQPLIVGGGINNIEKARGAMLAGADIIVVGNALEKNSSFLEQIGKLINEFNS